MAEAGVAAAVIPAEAAAWVRAAGRRRLSRRATSSSGSRRPSRNFRPRATTTPNHRWLNLPPKQRDIHADHPQFVTTDEVRSRDRIMLAAAAETPSTLDITVREAAILGWIAGDGHVERRAHRPTMSI